MRVFSMRAAGFGVAIKPRLTMSLSRIAAGASLSRCPVGAPDGRLIWRRNLCLRLEGHLAPDHDPFRYRSGSARIVVSNTCSAFRERKHFIGTSDRNNAITICGNCHEDPTSRRKPAVGPKLEDMPTCHRPRRYRFFVLIAPFAAVSWPLSIARWRKGPRFCLILATGGAGGSGVRRDRAATPLAPVKRRAAGGGVAAGALSESVIRYSHMLWGARGRLKGKSKSSRVG